MIEQRRFPRIHFKANRDSTEKVDQAFIHWRNLELSDVYDLSIGGLAASKPSLLPFYENDLLDFSLELGSHPMISVVAKVAWVGEASLGLSFVRLEAEGHLILRKFISEKLIGSHLRLMNREYHAHDADFDFWFAGPGESHFFLKTETPDEATAKIIRAEVLLDGDTFVWKEGVVTEGAGLQARILRILENAPEDQKILARFRERLVSEKK